MWASGSTANAETASLATWRAIPPIRGNSVLSPISQDRLGASRFDSTFVPQARPRRQRLALLLATTVSGAPSKTTSASNIEEKLKLQKRSLSWLVSPPHQNAASRVARSNRD